MRVKEREPGEVARLEELIAAEPRAKQRDRYRIALLAIRGEKKKDIARLLGVPTSVVEAWAYRYRDGGLEALRPKKQPGRPPTLPREKHEAFKARMMARPRAGVGAMPVRSGAIA